VRDVADDPVARESAACRVWIQWCTSSLTAITTVPLLLGISLVSLCLKQGFSVSHCEPKSRARAGALRLSYPLLADFTFQHVI
jgi:hypothetical protein